MSKHQLRFQINGETREVTVPAHRRLIDLIREDLALTQEDLADRQLHLKRAIHVGKRCIHELDVRAVVLEPAIVNLGAMAVGGDITALLRPEGQSHRCGTLGDGIQYLSLEPDLVPLQDLDSLLTQRRIRREQLGRLRQSGLGLLSLPGRHLHVRQQNPHRSLLRSAFDLRLAVLR